MLAIRNYLVNATIKKAYVLTNKNIRENIDEYYESLQQSIHADKSLTNDEKIKAEKILNKNYDSDKINYNNGKKRICEYCIKECLAKFFCENCIRNYLKNNFINWTSGNDNMDSLIRKCQMKSRSPEKIIEWIPYNNFKILNI
jgi:hypothetical protein